MDTLTNEGLRDIVRGYILKLYKFSETNLDITPINPITVPSQVNIEILNN